MAERKMGRKNDRASWGNGRPAGRDPLREPIRLGRPSTTACDTVFTACPAGPAWRSSWRSTAACASAAVRRRYPEDQVLAWADAYFAAHGKWPKRASGPIPGTRETWDAVASAMHVGGRGFRRGFSLAQLLAERQGVRNVASLPRLTERRNPGLGAGAYQGDRQVAQRSERTGRGIAGRYLACHR